MAESDPRNLVGTVLEDAYRLTRLIYEGGMGTVWEAQQLRLERRVAIKLMVPELIANEEGLARFRREVQVTSQLAHPHIIQLFDFGRGPDGQPYLAMEYLDGEDLEQRLVRVGKLSLDATVNIVRQVGLALTATHGKGVVHRDLKPANVFLLPLEGAGDFVKLVDFGISKVRTARTKLTRAFTMVGTPEYMSPEQATGKVDDVDHRSDQWALGCMVWRMLSGRIPFSGRDLNSLLEAVVRAEPLPLDVPDLPRQVEQVLRRALSKRQGDRFPTVSAFARALESAAATRISAPTAVVEPTPRPAARAPVAAAAPMAAPGAPMAAPGVPMAAPGAPMTAALAEPQRRGGLVWIVALAVAVLLATGAVLWLRERGELPFGPSAPALDTPATPEPRPAPAKRLRPYRRDER